MKPKLMITGAILIVGVLIFLPDTMDLLPNQNIIVDSVKNDLGNIQTGASESVGNTIDTSLDSVNTQIDDIKQSSQDFISAQIPSQFNEYEFFGVFGEQTSPPDSSERHTSNPNNTNNPNSQGNTQIIIPTVITTPEIQTISFETLSLVTEKQSDGNVRLTYLDSSGKTISVTVTIRNDVKILFTGQFFASSFETLILDAADTPHYIDMIVDHEDYGIISASAFNPAGNTDTTINGVFASD